MRHVVSFFFQNLIVKSFFFQILADLFSEIYQHQRTTCWKTTTAWVRKIFYECVACVCLTFGTIFLLSASFMAIGFLMRVNTISFALPIDLYKYPRIQKKVYLQRFFRKILNY